MRANVEWDKDPIRTVENDTVYWMWQFEVEREDVFLEDNDPVGLLRNDLHGVPIIKNLTETVVFSKPVFLTQNGDRNIWISAS